MTKKSLAILLFVVMIAMSTASATSHTFASLPQTDPSINTFWTKFKAAVIAGDKSGVATMSQFPIEMPYGIASVKNRSQLLRRYREVFNTQADARKCFANAQPTVDAKNRFTIGCKDAAGNEVVVYGFVRTRAGWKLKSLDNLNE